MSTVLNKKREFEEIITGENINSNYINKKPENTNDDPPLKKLKQEQDDSNNKTHDTKPDNDTKDEADEQATQQKINHKKKQLLIAISEKSLSKCEQLKAEASSRFIENDMTNAENKYLDALKYNPNDPIIYLKLSQIYFSTTSYHKALISAFKSVTFDPSRKQSWIAYGRAWMKLKHYKFAKIAFNTAETLENNNQDDMKDDFKFDDEYIAAKSELDTFANSFKDMYMNRLDKEINKVFDSILDNDENLRKLYFKHNGMSDELGDKISERGEMKQLMIGERIFGLVMESKYKSLEYINGLPQRRNCWNLTVEPQGIYKLKKKYCSDSFECDPMKIDTDEALFDFEKMAFQVQLCNSTSGSVVWVNKGHHGYNPSEWCDMNEHIIFGIPTAMQVIDIIKRIILYHRKGVRGECKVERPSNIVLTPFLNDESVVIKTELKKMNIGCYLPDECAVSMHFGPFDGHVMLC